MRTDREGGIHVSSEEAGEIAERLRFTFLAGTSATYNAFMAELLKQLREKAALKDRGLSAILVKIHPTQPGSPERHQG